MVRDYSYTLYVDGSGVPTWPVPFGKCREIHYVQAGVALTPEQDYHVHQGLRTIMEKHLGKSNQGPYELICHDLERAKPPFDALDRPELNDIHDEVVDLFHQVRPILFSSVVDKKGLIKRYGNHAYNPKTLAFRSMVDRFCKFLRRVDSVGYVVMDLEESKNDKQLQQLIHNSREDGIAIMGCNYCPRVNSHLENIMNTASFLPSLNSSGLQLADFCARKVFLHYERGKSISFNQLSSLFDTQNGKMWEPSYIPK